MMKCAGKLYTQLVPFPPTGEGTAACTDGRVRYLAGEIAHSSTLRCHYLPGTQGALPKTNLSRSIETWSSTHYNC